MGRPRVVRILEALFGCLVCGHQKIERESMLLLDQLSVFRGGGPSSSVPHPIAHRVASPLIITYYKDTSFV